MIRRHPAVVALAVWTLLIWTTRIGNIWRDDDLSTAGKLGDTALALSFTVLAVAVLVALWRGTPVGLRRTVGILAGWTVGVWLVRSVDILLDDWSVGFKVVHTALAVISVVLAALAVTRRRVVTEGSPVVQPTL